MTDEERDMMAAVLALPPVELLEHSSSTLSTEIGADRFYCARTVVQLIRAEREACAKACEQVALIYAPDGTRCQYESLPEDGCDECAAAIRAR
jgi:hypothetical protein